MKRIIVLLIIFCFISCETTKKTTSQVVSEANLLKSKEEGYFKAMGKDSSWVLEISEQRIRFYDRQKKNQDFMSIHVEPVRAADANVKLYSVLSGDESLLISIYAQVCEGFNNQKTNYKVEVERKGGMNSKDELFSGCGSYNIDYRLFDIWVLESLEGKELDRSLFSNDLPFMEINSSTQQIHGFLGCNRFNGSVFQEREALRFTQLLSTKMACEQLSFEEKFLKSLQQSTGYKIKNNRLYLVNYNQVIAVFRKSD